MVREAEAKETRTQNTKHQLVDNLVRREMEQTIQGGEKHQLVDQPLCDERRRKRYKEEKIRKRSTGIDR